MDKEKGFLGPREMSTGRRCWMHLFAVGNENIWGPFGKRKGLKMTRDQEKKDGISDDDHHLKFFSDQIGFSLTYASIVHDGIYYKSFAWGCV